MEWGALFKGTLVGKVLLDKPLVNILTTESIAKEPSKDSWTKAIKSLMPITVNILQVNDGRFDYRDLNTQPNTDLHIEQMQLTALNLANVQKTAAPLPSKIDLTGISIGDGRLKMNAEIDRSKTAFFSNVSHEFRTPLTLMLGPLEDLLQTETDEHKKAQVDATHRNAMRLLKLVNNLLDYSRVEAGACRQPINL